MILGIIYYFVVEVKVTDNYWDKFGVIFDSFIDYSYMSSKSYIGQLLSGAPKTFKGWETLQACGIVHKLRHARMGWV